MQSVERRRTATSPSTVRNEALLCVLVRRLCGELQFSVHLVEKFLRRRRSRPAHRAISTRPTLFTPLSAIAMFPSRVGMMLRTTPPPPGITHVWNFCVAGSNRTIVFGRTADSLYQMMPSIALMPYGCDFGPPGDAHSVTLPVFVS